MKAQEQVHRLQMQELKRKEEEMKRKERWEERLVWQEESYGDPQEDEEENEKLIQQQETEPTQPTEQETTELKLEDLAPPDIENNNNPQEITGKQDDKQLKENIENTEKEEKAETQEKEENQEKLGKKELDKPLKPRSIREVSKWIRNEESDDRYSFPTLPLPLLLYLFLISSFFLFFCSNDDVVLPKGNSIILFGKKINFLILFSN